MRHKKIRRENLKNSIYEHLETHVEHAIRFVENKVRDAVEPQRSGDFAGECKGR